LRTSKKLGVYWQFTNFHPSSMSDNYLLLGYSPDRTELLGELTCPFVHFMERTTLVLPCMRIAIPTIALLVQFLGTATIS